MVADGVGGWNDVGVDPALFSKHLTATVNKLYNNSHQLNLKELLVEAVK